MPLRTQQRSHSLRVDEALAPPFGPACDEAPPGSAPPAVMGSASVGSSAYSGEGEARRETVRVLAPRRRSCRALARPSAQVRGVPPGTVPSTISAPTCIPAAGRARVRCSSVSTEPGRALGPPPGRRSAGWAASVCVGLCTCNVGTASARPCGARLCVDCGVASAWRHHLAPPTRATGHRWSLVVLLAGRSPAWCMRVWSAAARRHGRDPAACRRMGVASVLCNPQPPRCRRPTSRPRGARAIAGHL